MKDDNGRVGIAVPVDSALGMLRTFLSEERRRINGKIVSREEAGAEAFDKAIKWVPAYLPDGSENEVGGTHLKSGMLTQLATDIGIPAPTLTAFLNARKDLQTLFPFKRLLKIVKADASVEEKILRKFVREEKETIAYHTPEALLSSPEFQEMDFKSAFRHLRHCFTYNEKSGELMTLEKFWKDFASIPYQDLDQYEPPSIAQMNRMIGVQSKSIHAQIGPMQQLAYYGKLGLAPEASIQMLKKSEESRTLPWANLPASQEALEDANEIFLSPADATGRVKSRRELLSALAESTCFMTSAGVEKMMTWKEASGIMLEALRSGGIEALSDNPIRSFTYEDLAKKLGVVSQLISMWRNGNEQILDKYIEPIGSFFNLSEPLVKAFKNAPLTPAGAVQHLDSADAYREALAQELGIAEPQETLVAHKFKGMREVGSLRDLVKQERSEARIR